MSTPRPTLIESWQPIAAIGAENKREYDASGVIFPSYIERDATGIDFSGGKSISKVGHIEQISQSVGLIASEELFYGYSK